MRKWQKRSTEIQDYFYCIIVGLLTGFLVCNTFLSVQWKGKFSSCFNSLPVLSTQKTLISSEEQYSQNGFPKKLLLLCVLTTRRNLDTRALALYRTISRDLRSDVIFFIGGGNQYDGLLPVVMLDGVIDEEYPPRRKSFAMLEYVNSYHGRHYDWFMRVDDDSSIHLENLENFLSLLDKRKLIYMGHPGLGSQKEEGHIGLDGNNPYCMGGPGVVLSRSLLNGIASKLKNCLNFTASNHEDSELGRCIYRHYGLSCTRAIEFQTLFHQNYEDSSGAWTDDGIKSDYLTLHPIKNETYIYKIHQERSLDVILTLEKKIRNLKDKVKSLSEIINAVKNTESTFSIETDENIKQYLNTHISWSCDYRLNFYSLRLKEWVEPSSRQGRSVSFLKARRGLVEYMKGKDIPKPIKLATLSYRRLDPMKGLEYILVTKDSESIIRTFLSRQNFFPVQFTENPVNNFNFSRISK